MAGEKSLYALRHLPKHLAELEDLVRLRLLLGSYSFLERKVGHLHPSELVSDYDYLPEGSSLRFIQSAVRLSAHILAQDPTQLPLHLRARLLEHCDKASIADLLEAAQERLSHGLVPIKASLTPPGGPLLQTFPGFHGPLALTFGEERVVSGSGNGTIRVWNIADARELLVMNGHSEGVTVLGLIPDGLRLLSGSWDQSLRIWNLETGAQEAAFLLEEKVRCAAVFPDGKRIVAGLGDGSIVIVELTNGVIRRLSGHQKEVLGLAVTPDGRHLVSSAEHSTLLIWDLSSGTPERLEGLGGPAWSIVITPGGDRVLAASRDGAIGIWSLADRRKVATLEGHRMAVTALALSRDGRILVSGSSNGSLRVWDLVEMQTLGFIQVGGTKALALFADGRRALVANGRLRLWDLSAPLLDGLEEHRRTITAVAFVPGSPLLVSASSDCKLKVWNTSNGREVRTLLGHTGAVETVAVTPDGLRAISGSYDKTLKIWDLRTGAVLRTLTGHEGEVFALCLSADGRLAVSGGSYLDIRVWSLADGSVIHTRKRPGSSGYLTTLAASPDGRLAIIGFQDEGDESPVILDLATGRVLGRLRGHEAAVQTSLILPDGHRILTGSYDATIRMWDLASQRELRRLEGHADRILSLAVTPDSRHAVSTSDDNTLRVWKLDTRECLAVFSGEGVMTACAISADARLIAAGEVSGNLHLFRMEGL